MYKNTYKTLSCKILPLNCYNLNLSICGCRGLWKRQLGFWKIIFGFGLSQNIRYTVLPFPSSFIVLYGITPKSSKLMWLHSITYFWPLQTLPSPRSSLYFCWSQVFVEYLLLENHMLQLQILKEIGIFAYKMMLRDYPENYFDWNSGLVTNYDVIFFPRWFLS